VLLPVKSQNDLKVLRKLIDVTNISISMQNRISKSAMFIPLNFEGMGTGESLILFSEISEGMGRGMGNSKELCFFFESLPTRRGRRVLRDFW